MFVICQVKLLVMSPLDDSRVLTNGVGYCVSAVLWGQEGSVACPAHHFSTHCLHFNLCRCQIIKGKVKFTL